MKGFVQNDGQLKKIFVRHLISRKSESAKECVTTHLPKQLALKMDGLKLRAYQGLVKLTTFI